MLIIQKSVILLTYSEITYYVLGSIKVAVG